MALAAHYARLHRHLDAAGHYVWPLLLRLILAWEFWESGITKYRGDNWFANIPWADWQKGFPFPFDVLPVEFDWFAATWGELLFAILLLVGLATRFTALSLIVITAVATAAVHWPAEWSSLGELWSGYVITAKGEGNFKLPLLFILMLLPLVFHGGGKLSLDALICRLNGFAPAGPVNGLYAAALAFAVLGVSVVLLEPLWGGVLFALAGLAAGLGTRWPVAASAS